MVEAAVMGMRVAVDVRGAGEARAAAGVFAWLRIVDATFSTYRPGSEVSRLRRGELALRDAHPLVREVLGRCESLRRETDGYFDAGSPPDPTGLVKGWAVDRAAALLEAAGARRYCVDAGGDVRVRGRPWRVGIRHPRERDRLAAVLELARGAVATSGTYERGHHILDPHSGRPATGALSVTVVGPDLATADAYATAAFAMGERGPAWLARLRGYAGLAILPGDRVLATPGFMRHVAGESVAASLRGPRASTSSA